MEILSYRAYASGGKDKGATLTQQDLATSSRVS